MSTHIWRLRRTAFAKRLLLGAALSIALMSLSAVPAWSAVTAEQQGAALLAQIQSGQTSCSKLSSANFALMGEYDMGRIMGSTSAYSAMNEQMRSIAGDNGEQLAYRFMGERLGGCAAGNGPVAFGTMMGMMGTSEMGASYGSVYPAGSHGSSMMSGSGSSNGATSGVVIAAIAIAAIALLALMLWFAMRKTPRRPNQPRTT